MSRDLPRRSRERFAKVPRPPEALLAEVREDPEVADRRRAQVLSSEERKERGREVLARRRRAGERSAKVQGPAGAASTRIRSEAQ